ncbi:MAG: hypothetical protein IKP95_00955 [Ruminococcus sp.]|nr:hypothetical protein [Ruminococcus sp.]
MNDRMLDIIGLADEEYLIEAARSDRINVRRRFSAGIIAAAAAVCALTVTAGAVAVGSLIHKDSVSYYHSEEMTSELEERGYAIGQVTENEHLRMTLEYLLVDENNAYGIITAEYLDSSGRNACNKVPCPVMLDSSGKNIFHRAQGGEIIQPVLYGSVNGNFGPDKTVYAIELTLHDPYKEPRTQLPDSIDLVFVEQSKLPDGSPDIYTASDIPENALEGLCLKISLTPNTETLRLTSESGHKAVISQCMYDIQYTGNEAFYDENNHLTEPMTLTYKDGTQKILKYSIYPRQSDLDHDRGHRMDSACCDIHGRFNTLLDLEGLVSVTYCGEVYNSTRAAR